MKAKGSLFDKIKKGYVTEIDIPAYKEPREVGHMIFYTLLQVGFGVIFFNVVQGVSSRLALGVLIYFYALFVTISTLMWLLAGKERVVLDKSSFRIEKKIWIFEDNGYTYDLSEIADIGIGQVSSKYSRRGMNLVPIWFAKGTLHIKLHDGMIKTVGAGMPTSGAIKLKEAIEEHRESCII